MVNAPRLPINSSNSGSLALKPLRRLRRSHSGNSRNAASKPVLGSQGEWCVASTNLVSGWAVWIVNTTVCAVPVVDTEEGVNVYVAPGGSPVALKVTPPGYVE